MSTHRPSTETIALLSSGPHGKGVCLVVDVAMIMMVRSMVKDKMTKFTLHLCIVINMAIIPTIILKNLANLMMLHTLPQLMWPPPSDHVHCS